MRATADYYGWSEHFESWIPNGSFQQGGYTCFQLPSRDSKNNRGGGKRIRISRSPSTCGHPAGLTNQFTISNSMRMLDLAELAHFTKGDWYWMESFTGQRISKEHWAEIYKAGGRQPNRGLVSV
jgi:hypothetical protein